LRDLILDYKPRYLLLDELDKATSKEFLNSLANVMETGMLVDTRHKTYEKVKVDINIYATANSKRPIPEHILSRFDVYEIPPYTDSELMRVITNLLVKRYNKSKKLAEAIAYAVVHELKTRDPRDAVRIAKIVDSIDDLKQYVRVKKKYSRRFRGR
jgi:Holliday junction DNA helicase RuvB